VRKSLAAFVTAFGLVLFALPAMASQEIIIPIDTVVRGAEGDLVVLATMPTGADAGCEATVTATADNNESVHFGNDLIVSSGADQVVLSDVESEVGKHTVAGSTLVLGDTISVTLRLGPADEGRPRSVFSGGITVIAACIPQETTTTTVETTTTTVETTTTTAPSTTTTSVVTTATTTPETTTTTQPTSSTSVLGTSTTTLPPVASTVDSTTTTIPAVTESTLPFTGPEDLAGLAMAGGALIVLGGAVVAAMRQQSA
jgi:hypothetical protein